MKWGFLNPRYTPHELALQMLIAIQENHITGVNSWLRRGADPNSKMKSTSAPPLHHAAYSAGVPVILLLLASGAKINGKDVYGKTAAHSSIRADRSDANLRQLLASGADPTATCKAGLTLLHMAIKERNLDCIVTLFNAGLDLDALKPSFYQNARKAPPFRAGMDSAVSD